MRLNNVLEKVNKALEVYETEDVIAIVPSDTNRQIRMFSVLTQYTEGHKFTAWLWDEKEEILTPVTTTTDIRFAYYNWMNTTEFMTTMHKAALEYKFCEKYGSVKVANEECIFISEEIRKISEDNKEYSSRLAIAKSSIPDENGYIELVEVLYEEDKAVCFRAAKSATGKERLMYVLSGEVFTLFPNNSYGHTLRFVQSSNL